MRTMLLGIAMMQAASAWYTGQQSKPQHVTPFYKVTKLDVHKVMISCPSGQIPDISPENGRIQESYVVISCSQ